MALIPSTELQKALYQALTDGSALPVYEVIPSSTAFPYITIGEEVLVDSNTKDTKTTVHNITFHTWSQRNSSSESKELNAYVKSRALSDLNINGFDLDISSLELMRTLREESNIFHGVVQIEFTLTQQQ